MGIHHTQHADGFEHAFGCRCRAKLQYIQELRCIAAKGGIALTDAVQEIKVFGLGKLLRFTHTGRKSFPREHRFDCREWVSAQSLGFDQRLSDPSVQVHLVIDRLT